MKFNIVPYYEIGDRVKDSRNNLVGKVIRSGRNPIVKFPHYKFTHMMENKRVAGRYLKLCDPVRTFINRKLKSVKKWL